MHRQKTTPAHTASHYAATSSTCPVPLAAPLHIKLLLAVQGYHHVWNTPLPCSASGIVLHLTRYMNITYMVIYVSPVSAEQVVSVGAGSLQCCR